MNYKSYYPNHRILRHTPLARCIAAILSSSIVVLPTTAIADSGGTLINSIYLGVLGASNNNVVINTDHSGDPDFTAAGAYSDTRYDYYNHGILLRNNVLEIASGGNLKHYAYAGYVFNNNGIASVRGNTLYLRNGSTVEKIAYGGYAEGYYGTANATANRVYLEKGGFVQEDVVGGFSSSNYGTALATDNMVVISGAVTNTNTGSVYGAKAHSANSTSTASGNRVIVSTSGYSDHTYGGYSSSTYGSATAISNTLNISGNAVKAYGGYTTLGLGTANKKANTVNNNLTISGSATDACGGYAESRKGTATASGNIVVIEHGGIVGLNAYGGWAKGAEYDSDNGIAIATGNQVIIKNWAKLGHDAYGGLAYSLKNTANASENTVILDTGLDINGSVYGGYADGKAGSKANNNKIILGSNLKPSSLANVSLYGGYVPNDIAIREIKGNTLEIWTKDLNVKSIANFDNYYFILPEGTQNGDIILKIVGGSKTALSPQTNFTAAVASGADLLPGSQITLINNESGIINNSNNLLTSGVDYSETLKSKKGVSLDYDFVISNDANNIYATVVDIKASPKTKAVMEGRLGGLGVLNLGADLATGEGMRQALGATEPGGTASGTTTVAPFAAASAGKQRLVTGSHVNVNSISGLAGVAARKNYDTMSVTGGVFFEFGYARNKTFNSTDSGDVNGKGNAHYYGLGLLSRLNLTDTVLKNMYFEGSVRFGRIFNDWHTNDMVDRISGKRAEFDSSNNYYGIHMGLGYVLQATDRLSLDMYGKVLWSHLDGKKTKVADDQYEFADVDSWRSRIGTRADYTLNDKVEFYAGAAWEHEFKGDAKAQIFHSNLSYDVPSPSTRGNSAVLDFGVAFNTLKPGLTLGFGVTGYLGKREGVSGNLQAKYEF